MKLRIALLQLLPGTMLQEQLEQGVRACREAKAQGADIALFPEMWSTGYRICQDLSKLQSEAISVDDAFVQTFRELASELEMAIGITFLGKNVDENGSVGKPFNSVALFDRHGELALHYDKVHACDFSEEKILQGGEGFKAADLDTKQGVVRVGSMICFDREFPESARVLMQMGAELILAPNACPMEINRLSALRTRAYENMLAVATCNYPAGQPDCNGHSTLFDGIAWIQSEPGVRDMCKLEAPEAPGIYVAELDIDMLRAYRTNEVMGDAYRRPDAYNILTEDRRIIETARLFLMPMRLRFLASTHEYAGDKETTKLMVFLPNDTLEDTRKFIVDAEAEWAKASPSYYEYAIVLDGKHIGGICLYVDETDSTVAELGWILNKHYWRQGICFEAAKALISYAREHFGIKHFVAQCDAENVASFHLMEKLGMTRTNIDGGRYNKSSEEERTEYTYRLSLE